MTQLDLGLEAKRKGKARAAKHHGLALELARKIARELAARNGIVSADAVRELFEIRHPNTPLGNAAGSIFDDGQFTQVGVVKSKRPSRHSALILAWRLKL